MSDGTIVARLPCELASEVSQWPCCRFEIFGGIGDQQPPGPLGIFPYKILPLERSYSSPHVPQKDFSSVFHL